MREQAVAVFIDEGDVETMILIGWRAESADWLKPREWRQKTEYIKIVSFVTSTYVKFAIVSRRIVSGDIKQVRVLMYRK